jgi:hypothetical protein
MNHPKILPVLGVTCLPVDTLIRSRADKGEGQSEAGARPDSTRRADPILPRRDRSQSTRGLRRIFETHYPERSR